MYRVSDMRFASYLIYNKFELLNVEKEEVRGRSRIIFCIDVDESLIEQKAIDFQQSNIIGYLDVYANLKTLVFDYGLK